MSKAKQIHKVIQNTKVKGHKDTFSNETSAKIVSDIKGMATYLANADNPVTKEHKLFIKGFGAINFTTEEQSLAKYKESNGA